ncbi:MAG: mobile mystery protein A [Gammaproteobacteria bacterium]|nr:mobile mystery protein A [Gammaproteobacteria bacterium]
MSVEKIVLSQYQDIVDRAAESVKGLRVPSEGWIRTVRKSFGMSGAQLARRKGVTRGLISNTEKAELGGGVTIKAMEQMAEALGCRFVYAIVPEKSVKDVVRLRAHEKAKAVTDYTDKQMALEAQSLDKKQRNFEIERLTEEFVRDMPSHLWDES